MMMMRGRCRHCGGEIYKGPDWTDWKHAYVQITRCTRTLKDTGITNAEPVLYVIEELELG